MPAFELDKALEAHLDESDACSDLSLLDYCIEIFGFVVSGKATPPYPGSSHASSKRSVEIVIGLFISCG